ncbi:hypothetical protein NQ318_003365 [Aromia moschata]|uniref:Uncharacterized protein n=1 Tax=Aromia moschata TaxID=1265417 RepID=A0AAV8Y923_9CUCU|nr:hypothetical protein NQ318_003365 [Aromia moschata]
MGGVDNVDIQLSITETVRKTMKWYRKVFFHLIDLNVSNAHALYKMRNEGPMPFPKFRLAIARSLLKLDDTDDSISRLVSPPIRLVDRHFPSHTTSRRCHMCALRERQGDLRRIQLLRNALLIPQIKFLTWDFPSQTGLVEISTTKFVGHLTIRIIENTYFLWPQGFLLLHVDGVSWNSLCHSETPTVLDVATTSSLSAFILVHEFTVVDPFTSPCRQVAIGITLRLNGESVLQSSGFPRSLRAG